MVRYRKTRIVCVSDTHGYSPAEAGFSLPPGDVLIHAGDLSNRGTKYELSRTFKWIEEANYEVKIVVAGNHDVSLDQKFYAEHGVHFHGDKKAEETNASSIDLLKKLKNTPSQSNSNSTVFLNHEATVIKLRRPDGPRTMFKVFGSPFSRFSGLWAFGYGSSPQHGNRLWDQIPPDTDILMTHTPPFGLCDRHAGEEDASTDNSRRADGMFGCKQLLDAIGRVRPMLAVCGHFHEGRGYQRVMWNEETDGSASPVTTDVEPLPPINSKKQNLIDLTGKKHRALENIASSAARSDSVASDIRAHTRLRKETCIVNAAIMAKSWPYTGGKAFNRPIVVDVNLPVWDDVCV